MTSTPAARSAESAEARREQILAAARAVIEEHGPAALTGQIADRAGLARPNVYRHFASKEQLDLAVARSAYRELRAAIRARIDLSGTPIEVIRAPVAAQVMWADEHPNLYRFLISRGHQQAARQRGDRGAFAAELAAAGARFLPRFGEDRAAAEAVLVGIIGLVDASVVHWLDRRHCSRTDLIDTLTTQAWLVIDHRLRAMGEHLDPHAPLTQAPRSGISTP
ncbi:TetR/AcrR family transcriptional regulator [Nocardia farcinica]|uniref:Putative transcriptional regulator n=1 Tax=Nocardia farcinica (strain IFM 10152) TaxID=247156 RepID=Q5YXR7_NOCFA|nr:TetR/AcrR family transcriptional regulator [Nocardia farcinica]BAD57024.1 putative transcriptional regulator [Nocardia farcinica IFM 10152]